ncbi:MAG TPA: amino acid adenylation domain-containing protein [Longimicrobiaceae bacterium]|nr:amino acid adenylation domain-containing protein [Longimicrobiaceae bacterium]
MATDTGSLPDPRVQGSYPLTPLQHGMLFQALLAPASGVNIQQIVCRLREPVDADLLERAWCRMAERHAVLRTRFRWADVADPMQEVLHEVRLGVDRCDHEGLAPSDHEARLQRYLVDDRARGFDLAEAPAMRLALFRHAADEHVLVWSFHHILLDREATAAVLREVFTLYDADRDGAEVELPARRPFREHVAWLRGRDPAADEAYWTARLRGVDAPTPLRGSRSAPRGPEAEPAYGEREIRLSPAGDAALRAFKRERGVNLNILAQGAWALLLGHYTGRDEVVFGLVRGGRATGVEGAEGMLGPLINTVPVRVALPAEARVGEWLREIAEGNAALRLHEHAALPDIARWSGLPTGEPLFDTILNYQTEFLEQAFHDPGDRWSGRSFRALGCSGYPLSVAVSGAAPLQVRLEYDAGLWDAPAADRMLGHLARLLEEIAADPGRRLGEIDALGVAERRQVVEGWNQTERPYPRGSCVHELFEAQVERAPDAVAAVCGGERLSYAELNTRANRLAHWLRERGVGPDARVGICAERGLEMLVGLLAILKAGGAYVPLDPAYPAERLRRMLEDGAPVVLLAHGVARESFSGSGVPVVDLVADAPAWADHPPANPGGAGLTPENLCYVIYTSGSTGRPKGVAMPHRPLVNLVVWQEPDWRRPGAAVTLQFTTISFDVSFQEIFTTWSTGGRLVVAPEEARHDPSALLHLVEREEVERLSLPWVMLQQLAEHAGERGLPPLRVREVQTAGEQLRITAPIRRWLGALGVPLHNHYGPSETHVVTSFTLRGAADAWPLLPPIGNPIANARVYVLDRHLAPVPAGVPGEIYAGGVCLARGYLDRPGLTAERFVPDPFGGAPGARLYRTGDRARWLPDGTLEFLGRVDHQVKIRGFRVEPGEVEAVLRRHPGVSECVVVAREDVPGERRLVAYVVGEVETDGLREHLRRGLPEYMVPGACVRLERLPLTPNGKLDRRALPAPEHESAGERFVAPRTPEEETLAGIWAEVLHLERVGVHDNFFALGGHSLLATRMISRVREAFGVGLTVRAILEAPTVEGLARSVMEHRSADFPGGAGEQAMTGSNPYRLLPALDELPDDELDRLLSSLT